jgi:DUF3048 family protein
MRRYVVLMTLAALVTAASCSSGGDGESTTTKPPKDPTTTTEPPPIAPLTGVPDPSGGTLTRPALTVKIDNADFENARPQTGLDQADVVYEELVEGDITRFAAVFHSSVPEMIGPIRSVRGMDPDLVQPTLGIFVYSGGTPDNVGRISGVLVTRVDENNAGEAFVRITEKQAPHNLFGQGQALFDFGGQPTPPSPLFEYLLAGEAFAGEAVSAFTVGFAAGYGATYVFDAATSTWRRDIGGVPFLMGNGVQIAPTNVVVQFTEYPSAAEGVLIGEGDAWVFTAGQLVRGRWIRPDATQPARYVDAAGQPIKLAPGQTWVELLPVELPVDVIPAAPPPPNT